MAEPLPSRYRDVFSGFDGLGVRYVVVGGLAVVLQGHPRMTVDLDLVVDLAVEPARRAIDVLESIGLLPRLPVPARLFADEKTRRGWVTERNLQVFSMYDPADPFREVDLFATEPVPFEDLYAASVVVDVGGQAVRVAAREHLIRMKEDVGRPRDLEDVAALRRLQDESG